MNKNLLTMLSAIMICGFTVTVLSACSSDNDDKTETPQEQAVKMFYVVEVSDDVLKVADVEVNYVDQTGAKQKEVMTSKKWIKALDTKTLPLTEGLWAKISPKSAVASGNYQLKVITVAGYEAKLADGKAHSRALCAPGSHLFGSLGSSGSRVGVGAIAVIYGLAVSQLGLIACCCCYFQLVVA